jgi:hypothetical protein
MPVTDCSGDVMLMDSDFSTDRGNKHDDRNCAESATILSKSSRLNTATPMYIYQYLPL